MAICDGCGEHVDAAHIRQRIERLELATRYRPIHIQVLFVDPAPPSRAEDFFYRVAVDRSVRSHVSRSYFDDIAGAAGLTVTADLDEKAALADFQRRGFFLVSAVECASDEHPGEPNRDDDLKDRVQKAAPTLLTRIERSYKPKHIVLLSASTRRLLPDLQAAGWADRLILSDGNPFGAPLSDRLHDALTRRTKAEGA